MIPKRQPIVSKKIRNFARGQDCAVRIPGICNHDPETTVLAHINGGGMGMKTDDTEAAHCCSACHDEIDRRTIQIEADKVEIYHLRGAIETRRRLFDAGLLKI